MGLNKDGMFRLKRRHDYPRPAAIIGGESDTKIEGWEVATCLTFSQRRYGPSKSESAATHDDGVA